MSETQQRESKNRDDFDAIDDFAKSLEEAYRAIRERKANGGEGWIPKEPT